MNSLAKAFFYGEIPERLAFPFPVLEAREKQRLEALLDEVRRFLGAHVDAAAHDERGELSSQAWAGLRELGLLGSSIGEEFSGLGLSQFAHTRVLSELASHDAALALRVFSHEDLVAQTLIEFAPPEVLDSALPKLARGELTAAFALAEDSSGSDASVMRTQLVSAPSLAEQTFRLTGEKRWVTGARDADLFLVFARSSALGTGNRPNMTAVLVPKQAGLSVGAPHSTLGFRAAGVCDLRFDDLALGKLSVIGEPDQGQLIAERALNRARLPLSGIFLGQARSIVSEAVRWAHKRHSHGRSIGEFSIVKDKIARMLSETFAIESMVYLTAGLTKQAGLDTSLESMMCRVAASEALWRVVSDAMSLAGGHGYVKPHPLERHLRDARGTFVIDSTNEILRGFIALRGVQAPGRAHVELSSALRDPLKSFGVLRKTALKNLQNRINRPSLSRAHPLLRPEVQRLEQYTLEFQAAIRQVLSEYGTEVAEMQYFQLRAANIAIDLYAWLACISRATRAIQARGEGGARRELDMTRMFARAAGGRVAAHLQKLKQNDDELRKTIAARAYEDHGYPFDIL